MGIAVGLTVLAGLAGAVQVAVMGRFGSRIGVVEALTFATGIQLLLAVTILLLARQGTGGLAGGFRAPPWMWISGAMGLILVFSITFAQPRIGVAATIGILVAGQFAMGAIIDGSAFSASRRSASTGRERSGSPSSRGSALSLVR